MIKPKPNYLILGYGVTGSKIAQKLSEYGKVFVTDTLPSASFEISDNITFVTYSYHHEFIAEICKTHNILLDSVIHTHLQNISIVDILISQLKNCFVKQVVTLDTLMTYNPKTWEKMNIEHDIFWNDYQFQKRLSEILLQKHCSIQKIKLFVPETFHILGPGFGIGISGPYFRMNQQTLKQYIEQDTLIIPSNKPKVIIDNDDFARFVVLGVLENRSGFYPIYNPAPITPKKYYTLMNNKLGIKKNIVIKKSSNIEPKCMIEAWTPKFQLPDKFLFSSVKTSIDNTLDYLLIPEKPLTRDIFSSMVSNGTYTK
jgi:hypothetical protein